jgi:hypothetical protein
MAAALLPAVLLLGASVYSASSSTPAGCKRKRKVDFCSNITVLCLSLCTFGHELLSAFTPAAAALLVGLVVSSAHALLKCGL